MEIVIAKVMLTWIAITLIAAAIGMWLTYWVLKCAIRDGIKEANIKPWWNQEPSFKEQAPIGYRWTLVREVEFKNTEPSPPR